MFAARTKRAVRGSQSAFFARSVGVSTKPTEPKALPLPEPERGSFSRCDETDKSVTLVNCSRRVSAFRPGSLN